MALKAENFQIKDLFDRHDLDKVLMACTARGARLNMYLFFPPRYFRYRALFCAWPGLVALFGAVGQAPQGANRHASH